MTGMAASLLLVLLTGQLPGTPMGAEQTSAVPKLHVVAAHASTKGNNPAQVDDKLAGVKNVLLRLPFDSYEPVADQEVEAPPGEETLVPLNGVYSLYVQPQGQDESGALALTARISMLAEGGGPEQYVDAIYTQARLASGMPLVFRGLDLNVGELVVVLNLSGDNNQQGQSQDQDSDQQQEEKDKQQDDQSSSDSGDQEQQNQQDQAQQDQGDSPRAQEETPDLQNIEALLKSLEETDRKEQEEQQRVRTGIQVRGDWW